MESQNNISTDGSPDFGPVVYTTQVSGSPSVIVVCEHASNRIPECLGDMGLTRDARQSHIAWDPGALPVARAIAGQLSAPLISGGVSRLVYDCNRPPQAPDAMPAKSEHYAIPANVELTRQARAARIDGVYNPFSNALSDMIVRHRDTLELMVTVHSFTPVYRGQRRSVELGLLHGSDARFAKAMMAIANPGQPLVTRLNEPYSAADGVAHTLDCHALPNGLHNVMLEIRNDLIETPEQQQAMADRLVPWIRKALTGMTDKGSE